MSVPDLNLLVTLQVLLEEGSVARAARRLQLSPSAMSRSLTRLRHRRPVVGARRARPGAHTAGPRAA